MNLKKISFICCCLAIYISSFNITNAAEGQKVKIRYKGTAGIGIKQHSYTKIDNFITSWKLDTKHTSKEFTSARGYMQMPLKDSSLAVLYEYKRSEAEREKQNKIEGPDDNWGTSHEIDFRGRRKISSDDESDTNQIDIQFPEEAVGPGDKWDVTGNNKDASGKLVKIQFKLVKYKKRDSKLFATIDFTTTSAGYDAEEKHTKNTKCFGRVIFNVTEGFIAKTKATMHIEGTFDKDDGKNCRNSMAIVKFKFSFKASY